MMENLYFAYRLLEDFGIGRIPRTEDETCYQKIKLRSDATLRMARIDMTSPIDDIEAYVKCNWSTIKETENLSTAGKLVSLFTLIQLLVCKYKIVSDMNSISLIAFLFSELASEIDWKDEVLVL